jgi:hypothetical protein
LISLARRGNGGAALGEERSQCARGSGTAVHGGGVRPGSAVVAGRDRRRKTRVMGQAGPKADGLVTLVGWFGD